MRRIQLPSIRLDKTNVDAPTINRALDNIISNVNTLANETSTAIDAIVLQQNPVDVLGGSGITVVESPTNTFTITNTDPASLVDVLAGSGIAVVESPTGTFTITNTLPENTSVLAGTGISVVQSPAGTFTITNTLPENTNIVAGQGINVTQSPAGTFTIDNTAPYPTPGYIQADSDQELSLSDTPTSAYNWTATTALNMGVQGANDEEVFSALYSQARYTLDGTLRILSLAGGPRAITIDIEYDNGDPITTYVIGPDTLSGGNARQIAVGDSYLFSRSGIVEVFGNRSIVVKLSVDTAGSTANISWTAITGTGNDVRIADPLRLTINNIT
jgi:hypothetical protein